MTSYPILLLLFCAGGVLGILYFGSVWLSVQSFARGRRPVAWLIGTAAIRIAALVAVLAVVMDGQWERVAACLAGFVVARLVMVRRLRHPPGAPASDVPVAVGARHGD